MRSQQGIVMFGIRFLHPARPLLPRLHAWLSSADDVRQADLIFVMAGNMSRKHYAMQLLRDGLAPRLLVSVDRFEIRRFSKMSLPIPLDLLKLAQNIPAPQRHFFVLFHGSECHVQHVQPRRLGTLTEVKSLARWLAANPQLQSLILVSNETHLRRVRMCCRHCLSRGVEVVLLAVPNSFSDSADEQGSALQSARRDLVEFVKVLVYWVLLALRLHRYIPEVRHASPYRQK